MRKIAGVDPGRLIMTDPPNNYLIATAFEYWNRRYDDRLIPPIVVVPWRSSVLPILDGNCRAYLLAHRNIPISALVLTQDSDRDLLLKLESSRDILPFPHREYLMEKMSLGDLKLQAMRHAQRYGFLTVRALLDLDVDRIEPVHVPNDSEIPDKRVLTHKVIKPERVECLIVYDNKQGEHFLPIFPKRLKEARRFGYECVEVVDLSRIRDGLAWAREHSDQLDATLLGLIQPVDLDKSDP